MKVEERVEAGRAHRQPNRRSPNNPQNPQHEQVPAGVRRGEPVEETEAEQPRPNG